MASSSGKKTFHFGWFIIASCMIACLLVAYQFILPTKKQAVPAIPADSQKPAAIIKDKLALQPATVQNIVNTKTTYVTSNCVYHSSVVKKYPKRRFIPVREKDLHDKKTTGNNEVTSDATTKTEANSIALLDSFYQSIAKQPVTFRIQPQQDTVLNLPEGTIIAIQANTWVHSNGHPVTEPVVFSVTEFYDKGSMICNRLSTGSNGQPLVTGGMLHLAAKDASGNEIAIKQNGSIDVQMPSKNLDKNMQLFLPVKNSPPAYNKKDSIFQMLELLDWVGFGQSQVSMPVPMVNVIDWTETPHWEPGIFFSNKVAAKFVVDNNSPLSNNEVKTELKKRFPEYDKIIVRREWKHPIKLFRKWRPATTGLKKMLTLAKAKKYKLITPQEEQESLKQFQENLKQYKNDSIRLAATAQIKNNYGFKVSNLGFINCDRFLNDPRPKVLYTINRDNTSEQLFVHRLFFHSINSIMSPYWEDAASFRNIPAGEKVTLVSVGVINNQTVASFKTFTTDNTSPLLTLDYQPTEPAAFKKELQSVLGTLK